MKHTALIAVAVLALVSCTPGLETETRNDDTVVKVSTDDLAMNQIMEEARKSVGDFVAILDDESIDPYTKSVKYPFDTTGDHAGSVEHIWVANVRQENGVYVGEVANDPFYVETIKFGDVVEVDLARISDWKYHKDGYIYGGKSIKYFFDRMSAEEQADFLERSGLKFPD